MKIKTYTVIALSVGGRGDKIFNSGETVTEKDFNKGLSDKLVEDNFLKFKEEIEDPNPEQVFQDENVEIEFIPPVEVEVHRKTDGTEGMTEETEEEKQKKATQIAIEKAKGKK